jgi:hypothetical protein
MYGFRNLEHIEQIRQNLKVAEDAHPVSIMWTSDWITENNVVYREASFASLLTNLDYVPIVDVCKTGAKSSSIIANPLAHFQIVIPKQYFHNDKNHSDFPFDKTSLSLCIQLPATGDQVLQKQCII